MTRSTPAAEARSARVAFFQRKDELARFAFRRMVNSFPAFKRGVSPVRRSRGESIEQVNRALSEENLRRHFASRDGQDILAIPSTSLADECLWTSLTFLGGPADRAGTGRLILRIHSELESLGLANLFLGYRGVLQILILYEEPVPDRWACGVSR